MPGVTSMKEATRAPSTRESRGHLDKAELTPPTSSTYHFFFFVARVAQSILSCETKLNSRLALRQRADFL